MLMVVTDTLHEKPTDIPWDDINSILFVSIADKVCLWRGEFIKDTKAHFVDFKQLYIVPPVGEGEPVPEELLVGCGLLHDKDVVVYGCEYNKTT